MSNKDLLKQAIAEAKTIREAAIANAKEALEETLTPHLKEMLAQKLQEMEEGEEEDKNVKNENIYEAEEEEVETEEGEEVEGEEEGNEDEELDFDKMSKEEFTELVLQIVHQDEEENSSEEELSGEEAPEGDDLTSVDDSEEIDINELLAELEGMDGELKEYSSGKVDPMSMFSGKETGNELDTKLINAVKSAAKKAGMSVADFYKKHIAGTPGEPMLQREEELEEYSSGKVDPMSMFSGKETGNELDTKLINAVKSAAKKAGMSVADFYKKHIAGTPGEPMLQRESEDLAEALATVETLRVQLQEVNLLNAKLLYVNKVFKSNNLSEGQKVNVIAAFDKAETVKEVKLVFETVSKNVVAKPATIKEHRSFASKATGNAQTTAPKEILSEVSDQVARWQKLAGIIKS